MAGAFLGGHTDKIELPKSRHQTFEYRNTTVRFWSPQPSVIEAEVELTGDHPHFAGHFPGFPILPAVSQIDLVAQVLEVYSGRRPLIKNFRRCKFTAMLKPNTKFRMLMNVENSSVRWELHSSEQMISKGQFEYDHES